ncbi:MAG: HNH endonuclease [Microbacterium sp.]|jgi:5-methylcytosine-specific restriction endonuclease McrA|uniref:HNH endonuclease n=1 Tax=Microbacterium sp. TaxID=51671 RepID=UPI00281C8092|nr:HNH endonuclease [Microbacterium sp.]MDR2322148.1 HNH endonuclease [Microbacterium sp.]
MTTEIHTLPEDAAVHYSTILATVAKALPTSFEVAEQLLGPFAGEVWMGSLTLHGKTAPGAAERSSRAVPDRLRAQVFLRDGFICSYCGGPTIPRCILVAISDVFPEAFPYYAHYRRGTVHPAYWVLAPEADHTLAHANGGSDGIENLTTMHAMCNTRKSSLAVDGLPAVLRPAADEAQWDGLLSHYADIVIAGNAHGRRHSAPGYHPTWLRYFDRTADAARVRESEPASS